MYGVTVLLDQVFIVRYETPEMELYDVNTLNPMTSIQDDGLIYPEDLASCRKFRCLYISD